MSFTNEEEEAVEMTDVVLFLLESRLKARGGLFSKAGLFAGHVVVSERLVTGQNPASAKGVGAAMAKLLSLCGQEHPQSFLGRLFTVFPWNSLPYHDQRLFCQACRAGGILYR